MEPARYWLVWLGKKGFSKALQRPSYKALQTSTKEGRKAHVVQSSDDRASSPYSRGRGYGGEHTLESNGKARRLAKE